MSTWALLDGSGVFRRFFGVLAMIFYDVGHRASLLYRAAVANTTPARNSRCKHLLGVRQQYKTRLAAAILWLLCFPAGHCMQLLPQGAIGSHVVFSTAPYTAPEALVSQSPSAARVLPAADVPHAQQSGSQRRFCVFSHLVGSAPMHLSTDQCIYGPALQSAVCQALSCDPQDHCLHRIVSMLPGIVAEQYQLAPLHLPWHQVILPVDLRPVGGNIQVVVTSRLSTGRAIAQAAADDQLLSLPANIMCVAGDIWLMPDAQPLLLPAGDTVQVWTVSNLARQTRAPSLHHLPHHSQPLNFAHAGTALPVDGHEGVVIHAGGLIYLPETSTASPNPLGQQGRQLFESDVSAPASRFWLSPGALAELPTLQYFADASTDTDMPCIVDFRPIGGRIVVSQVEVPPAVTRGLLNAVRDSGEPIPGQSVVSLVDVGRVALRAQQILSAPHAFGTTGEVFVLYADWSSNSVFPYLQDDVTLRHRSFNAERDAADIQPSSSSPRPLPQLPLWGMSLLGTFCAPSRRLQAPILVLLGAFHLFALEGTWVPDPAEPAPEAPTPSSEAEAPEFAFVSIPSHAGIAAHHRLAHLLVTQTVEQLPPLELAIGKQAAVAQQICFQVWHPTGTSRFALSVLDIPSQLGHRLRSLDPGHDRRLPVVAHPQLDWPCVQLVAPSKDPNLVTVLADIGRNVFCLDVARHSLAADLLHKLAENFGSQAIRLDRGLSASVRHGEILRVHVGDPAPGADVGPISLLPATSAADMWCQADIGSYVLGPDVPLQWHDHPPTATVTGELVVTAQAADQQTITVPIAPLANCPVQATIYCASRQDQPCHVFVVEDSQGHLERLVLQAAATREGPQDAFALLAQPDNPYAPFWQAIRATMPVLVFDTALSAGHPGPFCHHVVVDFLRAAQFGWRLRQVDSPIIVHAASCPRPDKVSSIGVQTLPSHWPLEASPLSSSTLPSLSRVQDCRPVPSLCPDGPVYDFACAHYDVVCHLPCLPDYHVWALRIGAFVYGACTASMDWSYILEVAEASVWDLSGLSIVGQHQQWAWPHEVASFSGHCGHLVHTGTDPYLCLHSPYLLSGPLPAGNTTSPLPQPTGSAAYVSFPSYLLWLIPAFCADHKAALTVGLGLALLETLQADGVRFNSSSDSNMSEVTVLQDDTRTCTVAWCHELACQTTHFSVSVTDLAAYIAEVAPEPVVRILLWRPFQGPKVFEIARQAAIHELQDRLPGLGHGAGDILYVAFDTQGTSLDVLSVPANPTVWWIVRDGLGRELLRPVTKWAAPGESLILTLNSHGQAYAPASSPEVARLVRLPQGARAMAAEHLTRVTGHITEQGLVLLEVAIGTITAAISAAAGRPAWPAIFGLLGLSVAAGMQPSAVAVRSPSSIVNAWQQSIADRPETLRIWTYSCSCPTDVPYGDAPDTRWLSACVATTGRGLPANGEYVWTQPRIVQGVAHILHVPPGSTSFTFWLLHYQARGHVIAGSVSTFDWGLVGANAAEAFAEGFFSQGHFGLYMQGHFAAYGAQIQLPLPGAILHLVRTSLQPSSSASIWDTPQGPTIVPPFDYDICLGRRGDCAVVPATPQAWHQGSPEQEQACPSNNLPTVPEDTAVTAPDVTSLTRKIGDVALQLQVLTTRLESMGLLPQLGTTDAAPAPDESVPNSAAFRLRPGTLGCLPLLGFLTSFTTGLRSPVLLCILQQQLAFAQDADETDSDAEPGPSEPNSPSLPSDLAAPTPRSEVTVIAPGRAIIAPSSDGLARTTAPGENAVTATPTPFDPVTVPMLQRRALCALGGLPTPMSPAWRALHASRVSSTDAQSLHPAFTVPVTFYYARYSQCLLASPRRLC